jgi:hypothetical protein
MSRVALGSCALGLALLAGCLAPPEDSAPQPPAGQPPVEQPPVGQPPAEQPPAEQPPAEQPPAANPEQPGNTPGEAYDAANHRVLYGDCVAGALMAVDLATGQHGVVTAAWPWADTEARACVQSLVVEPGGTRVFAVVEREVAQPGASACSASELVAIDTASGEVTPLRALASGCSGALAAAPGFSAPQIDTVHGQLLHLEAACDATSCSDRLTSTRFDGAEGSVLQPMEGVQAASFILDPANPDRSALLLRDDLGLDALDFTTGKRGQRARIQATWDDIEIQYATGVATDAERLRVFISAVALWAGPDALFVVVALDLVTGEQTLLYDGSPAADGAAIACHPDPSYDSAENRVLLVERPDAFGCVANVFSVDAETGEFARVSQGHSPAP